MELEHKKSVMINEICTLKGSTTEFLQKVSGKELKVEVVCQELTTDKEGSILTRIARLYFNSPEEPVLYCVSRLKKENITSEEWKLIMEGNLPIGKVFASEAESAGVEKRNIQVSSEINPGVAASLNSNVPAITKKQYEYYLHNREIGTIIEYFSYESLDSISGYNKHRRIIEHFKSDNAISDENGRMEYGRLPHILALLNIEFAAYRGEQSNSCFALRTKNTVGTALVILYLLSEKISFHMCSEHSEDGLIPPFCKKVITVHHDASAADFVHFISIENNPHHRQEQAIREGLVFLSSSGTSGPSKYISFEQDNLVANAKSCVSRFAFNNSSSVLVPVAIGHMYGMGVGLLPALLCGANVCLIERTNILKLFGKLGEYKPHFTLITPTVAKMIVMLDKQLPGKSTYITAGESMDKKTYINFESRYGELINLYGCTELGAIATSQGGKESAMKRHEGHIFPINGVKVKLDGVSQGEILCRHNAPFSGYVDKYGNAMPKQGEWYGTKDIGVSLFSGSFKVTGRVDNCINRSGFLISLEEVEQELNLLFSEINRAVVLSVDNKESLLARMIAVCELNDGCQLDAEAALKICRREMKRYHQPDEFHFVNTIPRLSNGKPDRHSLRKTIKNQ